MVSSILRNLISGLLFVILITFRLPNRVAKWDRAEQLLTTKVVDGSKKLRLLKTHLEGNFENGVYP
jgi:hypothetical protein